LQFNGEKYEVPQEGYYTTLAFQMRVDVTQDIRIYSNSGIYNKAHPERSRSVVHKDRGTVVAARRPKTCTATLAGAICPEVDLPFSHLVLLYTNHFDGAQGIMGWLAHVLPEVEILPGQEIHLRFDPVPIEDSVNCKLQP
jgi:hypothetical protein